MESKEHIVLVNKVLDYVKNIVPEELYQLIQVDSAGENSKARTVDNYIPDVYYSFNNILIIGEAKTINDYERRHSKEQFDAYIKECRFHSGEAVLLIGVPWQLVPSAKNYFRKIKKVQKLSFEIIIINEIGRYYII